MRSLFLLAVFSGLALTAQAHGDYPPSESVRLEAPQQDGHAFSLTDLRAIANTSLRDTPVTNLAGKELERIDTLRGILLRDLLKQQQVLANDPQGAKRAVVLVSAADGYRVAFSWYELLYTPVGDKVLIAVERDGQPLGAHDGGLALISVADAVTGPRFVKGLQSIRVSRLEP